MKKYVFIICILIGLTWVSSVESGFPKFDKLGKVLDGSKKLIKGVAGIGIQEELSIGGSVAVEIVANYGGLVRDEKIVRHVNMIGKTLGYYSDRPELQYMFGVLNSPDINAVAAPGGYIFITRLIGYNYFMINSAINCIK